MTLPPWAVDFDWSAIHEFAAEFGADPALVAAIIKVESGGNPLVMRAEPKFEYLVTPARFAEQLGITKDTEIVCQKLSWGLMQIMGGTARTLGYDNHLGLLLHSEVNIYWGCKYLGSRVKKYKSMKAAIAAYNAGSLRLNADGSIVNQKYVDKVAAAYEELK